jgi:hypothetical protein
MAANGALLITHSEAIGGREGVAFLVKSPFFANFLSLS